jgi:Fe-S cluster assembly protein SufD
MEVAAKRDLISEMLSTPIKGYTKTDQSLRDESKNILNQTQLPVGKSEEYRFTPIARTLEKGFTTLTLNLLEASVSSIENFLVADLKANILVFVNGRYAPQFTKMISSPDQLTVKPLSKALSENEEVINHFSKKADSKKDAFTALNTALWSEGLFIHVPSNTEVIEPVFILHVNDTGQGNLSTHTRLLCVVEENSELNIIEKFESEGTHSAFSTFVEEITVGKSASLNYYKIQNDHGKSIQVCNTAIHQSDKSHVNTFTLTLDGQLIRNNLSIFIDGENCESHFHGLYLLTGNTLADNHTVVDHLKPNSFSNELYKGVMDGNAKGVFNGKIFVRPHAQKTNAFQSNRNVLLTDTAVINTKPQLEIWADDVKCSHGCTTGQLDEEALFYLQSRGISKDTARSMLLYAFASEVIDTIKDEKLKAYFDALIAERLHKNF